MSLLSKNIQVSFVFSCSRRFECNNIKKQLSGQALGPVHCSTMNLLTRLRKWLSSPRGRNSGHTSEKWSWSSCPFDMVAHSSTASCYLVTISCRILTLYCYLFVDTHGVPLTEFVTCCYDGFLEFNVRPKTLSSILSEFSAKSHKCHPWQGCENCPYI